MPRTRSTACASPRYDTVVASSISAGASGVRRAHSPRAATTLEVLASVISVLLAARSSGRRRLAARLVAARRDRRRDARDRLAGHDLVVVGRQLDPLRAGHQLDH